MINTPVLTVPPAAGALVIVIVSTPSGKFVSVAFHAQTVLETPVRVDVFWDTAAPQLTAVIDGVLPFPEDDILRDMLSVTPLQSIIVLNSKDMSTVVALTSPTLTKCR